MTTASIMSAAVAAIIATLQAAPAVCAVVQRTRLRPLSEQVPQAVVVRPLEATPGEADNMGNPVFWQARIAVDCYARAEPGQSPDEAVDPVVTALYARLMADPTLGGPVRWMQPGGLVYDYDAEAESVCCASFTFLVLLTAAPSVFTP